MNSSRLSNLDPVRETAPFYVVLVEDGLELNTDFISAHLSAINRRFYGACQELEATRDFGDAFPIAINLCIHLASSLVLLGTSSDVLDGAIARLEPLQADRGLTRDPTTTITISTLRYVLVDYLGVSDKELGPDKLARMKESYARAKERFPRLVASTDRPPLSRDPGRPSIAPGDFAAFLGDTLEYGRGVFEFFERTHWIVGDRMIEMLLLPALDVLGEDSFEGVPT